MPIFEFTTMPAFWYAAAIIGAAAIVDITVIGLAIIIAAAWLTAALGRAIADVIYRQIREARKRSDYKIAAECPVCKISRPETAWHINC